MCMDNENNNFPTELSIFGTVHYELYYILWNIKMRISSWAANNLEPGQTSTRMCKLAWHYMDS